MTANIVPITDNVPAARAGSANQPAGGVRRRTSSLTVIAAATTTTRTSAAIQVLTANYSRRATERGVRVWWYALTWQRSIAATRARGAADRSHHPQHVVGAEHEVCVHAEHPRRVIVSQFPTVATIFATTGESVDRMAELLPRLR